MTERERAREHATQGIAIDRDDVAPGRASRSSQLVAPLHPISSPLLRKATRDDNGVAPGADRAVAEAATSSGSALPDPVLRKFESSLGVDLSGVRVHTGEASATAAEAVGAKAYTIGQDIHFAAGQYDPRGGEQLLAHEVAHTVQQRGATPARQNKLAVSSPFDAAEHEADRAADAMVAGQEAMISTGGGVQRQVFRDKDPKAAAGDDKQWATDARAKIEQLQNAITAAMTALNTDAAAAAVSLREAKTTCEAYETKFKAAKSSFISHVKKAIEEQKEFEEMLKQTLEVVLVVGSGGGVELAELAEKTAGILKKIAIIQTAAGVAPAAPKSRDVTAGPSGVDWHGVIDKSLKTLTSYIQQNSGLTAMVKSCTDSDHWLNTVIEGHASAHARQSAQGVAADRLATGAADSLASLGSLAGGLSGPAAQFAASVKADLTARGLEDQKRIERDIAIKWMASQPTNPNGTTNTGWGGRGSAEIHAAREYLETLGVIGAGSRTGVDIGVWDTDTDDDMIVARAKVEAAAMKLVGTVGEWQGGKINGAVASGQVLAGDETWKATGQAEQKDASMGTTVAGLIEAAGGNVRIKAYTIAPISKLATDAPQGLKAQLLHDLVTLTVVADGKQGGGVTPRGPEIKPAPARGDDDGGD